LDRADGRCEVLEAGHDGTSNRGVNDILIAIVDGLKDFPDAINAVFPDTLIQTYIVHLIRNSLDCPAGRNTRRWPVR
jgi:transposase-like protein